jgi:ABC-type transporter Mla MlaB component
VLKIQATTETATDLTVALIGTVQREYLPEIEDVVKRSVRDRRRLAFDLSQVRLVDRDVVAFFVSGEGRLARLSGCPSYLREWMASEARNANGGRD